MNQKEILSNSKEKYELFNKVIIELDTIKSKISFYDLDYILFNIYKEFNNISINVFFELFESSEKKLKDIIKEYIFKYNFCLISSNIDAYLYIYIGDDGLSEKDLYKILKRSDYHHPVDDVKMTGYVHDLILSDPGFSFFSYNITHDTENFNGRINFIDEIEKLLDLPKDESGAYIDALGQRISMDGNPLIKKPRTKIYDTCGRFIETYKCKLSFAYFRFNYTKIITSHGVDRPDLRKYQLRVEQAFLNKPFNLLKFPRQSGKCVTGDTEITIRNKKTGEEQDITMEDFEKMIKNRRK